MSKSIYSRIVLPPSSLRSLAGRRQLVQYVPDPSEVGLPFYMSYIKLIWGTQCISPVGSKPGVLFPSLLRESGCKNNSGQHYGHRKQLENSPLLGMRGIEKCFWPRLHKNRLAKWKFGRVRLALDSSTYLHWLPSFPQVSTKKCIHGLTDSL